MDLQSKPDFNHHSPCTLINVKASPKNALTTHFHVKPLLTKPLPANVYMQATWASVGVTVLNDKAYSMLETVQ